MGKQENSGTLVNVGLLVIRVGIGIMFIVHGWPMISGGPASWAPLGQAIGTVGIHFGYPFWGFMAAFAEFVGGIALILGLFTRFFSLLMLITMVVAVAVHLGKGDDVVIASHAIEMAVVFLGLLFTGAGSFSAGMFINRGGKK